jgi:hypothetical protein
LEIGLRNANDSPIDIGPPPCNVPRNRRRQGHQATTQNDHQWNKNSQTTPDHFLPENSQAFTCPPLGLWIATMFAIAEVGSAAVAVTTLHATVAMAVATVVMAAATIVNVFPTFMYVHLTHLRT